MTALQSHTTSNTATVAQYAAHAALTLGESVDATVRAMVAEFKTRRDAALPILRASKAITVLPPEGAFYFYIKAPGAGREPDPSAAFCRELLEKAGVAIVPGSAFRTPDWVRVSYAADKAQVVEAAKRIAATADAMA